MDLRKAPPGTVYSTLLVAGILLALLAMGIPSAPVPAELADNGFRGRRQLITAFTSLRYSLGDRVFNRVVVGKEEWFFITEGTELQDYQRASRLSGDELERFHRAISRLSDVMETSGGAVRFLPAPNKSTIYPQYMPDEIPVLGAASWLDQIVEYSDLHGTPGIVDVRPALLRESRTQQLYFKADSHWNELGAYYAYVEIVNSLLPKFPEHQPRPMSAFSLETRPEASDSDLARIMGWLPVREDMLVLRPLDPAPISRQTMSPFRDVWIQASENPHADATRVLVLGDSFLFGLYKFIELEYGSSMFVLWRELSSAQLYRLIRRYDPDIVIIECVERNLQELLPVLDDASP